MADGDDKFTLVSPDEYEYLDYVEDELLQDPYIDEDDDDFEESSPEQKIEEFDDREAYSHSIFDILDDEDAENVEETSTIEDKITVTEDKELFKEEPGEEEFIVPKGAEVIEVIMRYCPDGFSFVRNYIETSSKDSLVQISEIIKMAIEASQNDKIDKTFSVKDEPITFIVTSQTNKDDLRKIKRLEHVGALMVSNRKDCWSCVTVVYNEDGTIKEAEFDDITHSTFNEMQWKIVLEIVNKMKAKR